MGKIFELVKSIPLKGWILIAAFLGVPTSIYGVQWVFYKLAKQEANCYSDLNMGLAKQYTVGPDEKADKIQKLLDSYTRCVGSVDPKIGTVKFIRQEVDRAHQAP